MSDDKKFFLCASCFVGSAVRRGPACVIVRTKKYKASLYYSCNYTAERVCLATTTDSCDLVKKVRACVYIYTIHSIGFDPIRPAAVASGHRGDLQRLRLCNSRLFPAGRGGGGGWGGGAWERNEELVFCAPAMIVV